MKSTLLTASLLAILTSSSYANQEAGIGLETNVATGYGLYAVTMRASESPGAISSFYLYDQNGSYPSRWHEIDLEFSPGFTGAGRIIDNNHPHFKANGECYAANSADTLPTKDNCKLEPFLTNYAGSALSFNTYNYRSIDGDPYAHSNEQVFMTSNHGKQVFSQFYTYYFYYTPKGIYWTKDLEPVKLTMTPPAVLPQPSFVKQDFNVVEKNPIWNAANSNVSQAFEYDSAPLNPVTSEGKLTATGALMKMSMNLWDGSNTDPSHTQDWGGAKSPEVGSSSSYLYVAYYPLETNVNDVGNDPTKLKYGTADIYSDFTTNNGKFYLHQNETAFTTLWHVSNGTYIWPLGQLDERNLYCGNGELTMKISHPYAEPRKNYEKVSGCAWLNQN